jgi:broad specificity phosphatase PhoE
MPIRLGLLLSLVLVAGCASWADCPQATTPEPVSAPRTDALPEATPPDPIDDQARAAAEVTILLVRHGEKADDGTSDPPLTERGRERAACLAEQLVDFAPTHLFATPYRRNRETIEPLAAATKLVPTVIDPKDGDAWQRALRRLSPGSRAVVVGHSNSLPGLVTALGGELSGLDGEGNLPHDQYDRLVLVVRYASGRSMTFETSYCGKS